MQTNVNQQTQTPRETGMHSESPVKISDAAHDALCAFQTYAKERPDVVALWAFGIGFVLGWKLKPW